MWATMQELRYPGPRNDLTHGLSFASRVTTDACTAFILSRSTCGPQKKRTAAGHLITARRVKLSGETTGAGEERRLMVCPVRPQAATCCSMPNSSLYCRTIP